MNECHQSGFELAAPNVRNWILAPSKLPGGSRRARLFKAAEPPPGRNRWFRAHLAPVTGLSIACSPRSGTSSGPKQIRESSIEPIRTNERRTSSRTRSEPPFRFPPGLRRPRDRSGYPRFVARQLEPTSEVRNWEERSERLRLDRQDVRRLSANRKPMLRYDVEKVEGAPRVARGTVMIARTTQASLAQKEIGRAHV